MRWIDLKEHELKLVFAEIPNTQERVLCVVDGTDDQRHDISLKALGFQKNKQEAWVNETFLDLDLNLFKRYFPNASVVETKLNDIYINYDQFVASIRNESNLLIDNTYEPINKIEPRLVINDISVGGKVTGVEITGDIHEFKDRILNAVPNVEPIVAENKGYRFQYELKNEVMASLYDLLDCPPLYVTHSPVNGKPAYLISGNLESFKNVLEFLSDDLTRLRSQNAYSIKEDKLFTTLESLSPYIINSHEFDQEQVQTNDLNIESQTVQTSSQESTLINPDEPPLYLEPFVNAKGENTSLILKARKGYDIKDFGEVVRETMQLGITSEFKTLFNKANSGFIIPTYRKDDILFHMNDVVEGEKPFAPHTPPISLLDYVTVKFSNDSRLVAEAFDDYIQDFADEKGIDWYATSANVNYTGKAGAIKGNNVKLLADKTNKRLLVSAYDNTTDQGVHFPTIVFFDSGQIDATIKVPLLAPLVNKWKQEAGIISVTDNSELERIREESRIRREQAAAKAELKAQREEAHKQESVDWWESNLTALTVSDGTDPYAKRKHISAIIENGRSAAYRGIDTQFRNIDIASPIEKSGENTFIAIGLYDINEKFLGAQKIYNDGSKKFIYGTSVNGAMHSIGSYLPGRTINIVEGYATGLSTYGVTGDYTVVAISADNLEYVTASLREVYPDAPLRIVADNDSFKPHSGNTGLRKSLEVAHQYSAEISMPDFSEISHYHSLMNDHGDLVDLPPLKSELGSTIKQGEIFAKSVKIEHIKRTEALANLVESRQLKEITLLYAKDDTPVLYQGEPCLVSLKGDVFSVMGKVISNEKGEALKFDLDTPTDLNDLHVMVSPEMAEIQLKKRIEVPESAFDVAIAQIRLSGTYNVEAYVEKAIKVAKVIGIKDYGYMPTIMKTVEETFGRSFLAYKFSQHDNHFPIAEAHLGDNANPTQEAGSPAKSPFYPSGNVFSLEEYITKQGKATSLLLKTPQGQTEQYKSRIVNVLTGYTPLFNQDKQGFIFPLDRKQELASNLHDLFGVPPLYLESKRLHNGREYKNYLLIKGAPENLKQHELRIKEIQFQTANKGMSSPYYSQRLSAYIVELNAEYTVNAAIGDLIIKPNDLAHLVPVPGKKQSLDLNSDLAQAIDDQTMLEVPVNGPVRSQVLTDDDRLTFTHDIDQLYPHQTDGAINLYKNKTKVGTLSYSEFEGDITIKMIDVGQAHQRQGFATKLYTHLFELNPGKAIEWGMKTDQGTSLYKHLERESLLAPNYLRYRHESNIESVLQEFDEYALYLTDKLPDELHQKTQVEHLFYAIFKGAFDNMPELSDKAWKILVKDIQPHLPETVDLNDLHDFSSQYLDASQEVYGSKIVYEPADSLITYIHNHPAVKVEKKASLSENGQTINIRQDNPNNQIEIRNTTSSLNRADEAVEFELPKETDLESVLLGLDDFAAGITKSLSASPSDGELIKQLFEVIVRDGFNDDAVMLEKTWNVVRNDIALNLDQRFDINELNDMHDDYLQVIKLLDKPVNDYTPDESIVSFINEHSVNRIDTTISPSYSITDTDEEQSQPVNDTIQPSLFNEATDIAEIVEETPPDKSMELSSHPASSNIENDETKLGDSDTHIDTTEQEEVDELVEDVDIDLDEDTIQLEIPKDTNLQADADQAISIRRIDDDYSFVVGDTEVAFERLDAEDIEILNDDTEEMLIVNTLDIERIESILPADIKELEFEQWIETRLNGQHYLLDVNDKLLGAADSYDEIFQQSKEHVHDQTQQFMVQREGKSWDYFGEFPEMSDDLEEALESALNKYLFIFKGNETITLTAFADRIYNFDPTKSDPGLVDNLYQLARMTGNPSAGTVILPDAISGNTALDIEEEQEFDIQSTTTNQIPEVLERFIEDAGFVFDDENGISQSQMSRLATEFPSVLGSIDPEFLLAGESEVSEYTSEGHPTAIFDVDLASCSLSTLIENHNDDEITLLVKAYNIEPQGSRQATVRQLFKTFTALDILNDIKTNYSDNPTMEAPVITPEATRLLDDLRDIEIEDIKEMDRDYIIDALEVLELPTTGSLALQAKRLFDARKPEMVSGSLNDFIAETYNRTSLLDLAELAGLDQVGSDEKLIKEIIDWEQTINSHYENTISDIHTLKQAYIEFALSGELSDQLAEQVEIIMQAIPAPGALNEELDIPEDIQSTIDTEESIDLWAISQSDFRQHFKAYGEDPTGNAISRAIASAESLHMDALESAAHPMDEDINLYADTLHREILFQGFRDGHVPPFEATQAYPELISGSLENHESIAWINEDNQLQYGVVIASLNEEAYSVIQHYPEADPYKRHSVRYLAEGESAVRIHELQKNKVYVVNDDAQAQLREDLRFPSVYIPRLVNEYVEEVVKSGLDQSNLVSLRYQAEIVGDLASEREEFNLIDLHPRLPRSCDLKKDDQGRWSIKHVLDQDTPIYGNNWLDLADMAYPRLFIGAKAIAVSPIDLTPRVGTVIDDAYTISKDVSVELAIKDDKNRVFSTSTVIALNTLKERLPNSISVRELSNRVNEAQHLISQDQHSDVDYQTMLGVVRVAHHHGVDLNQLAASRLMLNDNEDFIKRNDQWLLVKDNLEIQSSLSTSLQGLIDYYDRFTFEAISKPNAVMKAGDKVYALVMLPGIDPKGEIGSLVEDLPIGKTEWIDIKTPAGRIISVDPVKMDRFKLTDSFSLYEGYLSEFKGTHEELVTALTSDRNACIENEEWPTAIELHRINTHANIKFRTAFVDGKIPNDISIHYNGSKSITIVDTNNQYADLDTSVEYTSIKEAATAVENYLNSQELKQAGEPPLAEQPELTTARINENEQSTIDETPAPTVDTDGQEDQPHTGATLSDQLHAPSETREPDSLHRQGGEPGVQGDSDTSHSVDDGQETGKEELHAGIKDSPGNRESIRGSGNNDSAGEAGTGRDEHSGDVETVKRDFFTPSSVTLDDNGNEISKLSMGDRFELNKNIILKIKELESEGRPAAIEEKHLLSKYSGWGGIPEYLTMHIEEHVTPEEYASIKASTLNAHYTSFEIIDQMWSTVERLGFKGGIICDPSVGTGHFIGRAPQNIRESSQFIAVDLDPIACKITKFCYEEANVLNKAFEKTNIPPEKLDLVITNVPFGDYTIKDKKYKGENLYIHDYFIRKSVDLVKPNGIVMVITSTGTMDKLNTKARQRIAEQADLMGAVRLPNGAFKESANTEVSTDILIFRKRFPGEVLSQTNWVNTTPVELPPFNKYRETAPTIKLNNYYADNPEKMLGTATIDTQYNRGEILQLEANEDIIADLNKGLNTITESLPEQLTMDELQQRLVELQDDQNAIEKTINLFDSDLSERSISEYEEDLRENLKLQSLYKYQEGLLLTDTVINNPAASTTPDTDTGNSPEFKIPAKDRKFGRMVYDPITEQFGTVIIGYDFTLLDNGESITTENYSLEYFKVAKKAHEQLKDLINLRDITIDVIDSQLQQSDSELYLSKRTLLNDSYDEYVEKHGPVNGTTSFRLFHKDTDSSVVFALEDYNPTSKLASKRDIFDKRTIKLETNYENIDNPHDALMVSLDQKGKVDIEYISVISNLTTEEVIESLKDRIIIDPATNQWERRDVYLSGDIYNKIEIAQDAAQLDPQFKANVELLTDVIPPILSPADIDVSIGSSWVPTNYYSQFIDELLTRNIDERSNLEETVVSHINNKYHVKYSSDRIYYCRDNDESTFGSKSFPARDLFTALLNKGKIVVYHPADKDGRRLQNKEQTILARQNADLIKKEFKEWIFYDLDRAQDLQNIYNRQFNSIKLRDYSGDYLSFPEMTSMYKGEALVLREPQKNIVARYIEDGSALSAHPVGTGKSIEYICCLMEAKRLGKVSKGMLVVPNHLVDDFRIDIAKLYPRAKVLTMDFAGTSKDKRKLFAAQAATNNWDIILVPHSTFDLLPVSSRIEKDMISDEISQLNLLKFEAKSLNDVEKRITMKAIQSAQKKLESRLEQLNNHDAKDDGITIEQMGIDAIAVDEAHRYKNLHHVTKLNGIPGVNTSHSQRAQHLYVASRLLEDIHGQSKGMLLGTATPLVNTLSEIYNAIRLTNEDILRERGLSTFDDFASTFFETVTTLEMLPEGTGYRENTRLSNIVNVPELCKLFRTCADVITKEEANLVRPKVNINTYASEPCEWQQLYFKHLTARAIKCRGGAVDPAQDNLLKIVSDGTKAALDIRLIEPDLPDNPESKINKMIDRIHDNYNKGTPTLRTQAIMLDKSTPNKKKFNLYHDIRDKLIERGIPSNEIAIIHDYKTKKQKSDLFQQVRDGHVRLIFGSTEKLGTGTNMQDKLLQIEHVDIGYTPHSIEQRNGRADRPGNSNKEIDINFNTTKDSVEIFRAETVKRKAKFIEQALLHPDKAARRYSEETDPTMAEFIAISTGNTDIKDKIELEIKIDKLSSLEKAHEQNQWKYKQEVAFCKERIDYNKSEIDKFLAIVDHVNSFKKVTFELDGRSYTDKKSAGKALYANIAKKLSNAFSGESINAGTIFGFTIRVDKPYIGKEDITAHIMNENKTIFSSKVTQNPTLLMNRLWQFTDELENSISVSLLNNEQLTNQIAVANKHIGEMFDQQDVLDDLRQKLIDLDQKISLSSDTMTLSDYDIYEFDNAVAGYRAGAALEVEIMDDDGKPASTLKLDF